MKKTPKNQKSNHLPSSKKNVRAANMKERSFNMESLEPRHLLSGVSFDTVATGTLVDAETFYATVDLENGSASQCYVTMNVADADGGAVVNAADIHITDADGNVLSPINVTQNGQVTSLLLNMGMGTDYTVTINNFDQQYGEVYVLFIRPGDTDADGTLSSQEYDVAYGQMLKGLEINAATAAKYRKQTGVDISQLTVDPALDLNGNGRFDTNEFMQLVQNNQADTLLQNISVKPKLDSLQVNGEDVLTVDDVMYANAGDGAITISGTLAHMSGGNEAKVVVKDADGNELASTQTSSPDFSLNVPGVGGNDTLTIELSYVDKPNTESTYTLQLDNTAPAPTISEIDVANTPSAIDYTAEQMGETAPVAPAYPFSSVSNPAVGLSVASVDESMSEWQLVVVANNTKTGDKKEYKRYTFKGTDCTEATDEIDLEDGLYQFAWYAEDALGNKTGETAFRSLYIDTAAPDFQIATPALTDGEAAYINDDEVVPTFTGNAVPETVQIVDGEGNKFVAVDSALLAFTRSYALNHGENTLSFTIFDDAGNQTVLTRTVISNLIPELSAEGEALAADGYVQLAADDAEVWSPEVAPFFADDAADSLTFEVESSNERVTAAVEDGKLVFQYDDLMDGEISYDTTITVKATDDYGETAEMSFNLKYTLDDAAPVVTLDLSNYEAEEGVYATNTYGAITLNGQVTDTTGIEAATLYVHGPAGLSSTVNLMDGSFSGDLVTEATAMDANGNFTVTLASSLAEGAYEFTYTSKDTLEHETEGEVQIAILEVDRTFDDVTITGPAAIAFAGLNDGDQTNATEVTAEFVLNTDMPECEDARFYIHVMSEDATEEITMQPVTLTCGDNPLSVAVPLDGLEDGVQTNFNFEIRDAAGNLYAAFPSNTLVPDWTAPAFTAALEGDFSTSPKVPNSQYYTENADIVITGLESSTETADTTYSVYLNDSDIGNPASGRQDYELSYGRNELEVYMQDAAGNTSDTQSFIVHYNQAPTVTPAGTDFSSKYFIQDSHEEWRTVDLTAFFDDEAMDTMAYSVSCDNAKIGTAVQDGVLSFTYEELADGESSYNGVVTIVATDEYGKEVELSFTAFYTEDGKAPEVTLDLSAYQSPLDESVYATSTTDAILLSGNVSDATGYEGGVAKLNIACSDGKSAVVDLLAGTWTGDAIVDFVTAVDADGNYSVALVENVGEGTYTFSYDSQDILGNEATGVEIGTLIVDRSADDVTFSDEAVAWSVDSPINVTEDTATFTVTADAAADLYIKVTATPKDDTAGEALSEIVPFSFVAGANSFEKAFSDLAEGKYEFGFQILDAAGNVYVDADGGSLVIDLTAPELDPAQNALTYQEGTYEKGVEDGEYYTDNATASIQNLATVAETLANYAPVYYTLSLNGAEAVNYAGEDLALVYGRNEIVLTPQDEAGNVGESKTFVIHYNVDPVLSADGEDLQKDGFVQNVPREGEELATIDLATLFTDEEIESYTVANEDESLVKAVNNDGVLEFTYGEIPPGAISINANVTVTATDVYGKTAELTFNVLYTFDSDAPKADLSTITLTADGENVNTSIDGDVPFATAVGTFTVAGTVKDTTDILEVSAVIQNADGDAIVEAQSATFDEKTTSWNFSFDLAGLADGTYTLVVTGKDSLGNDSTVASGTLPAQEIAIVVAQSVPSITEVIASITPTGTSDAIVNAAEFNFTSAASDAAQLTIYARKAGAEDKTEIATIAADSTELSYNIGDYLELEDGESYEIVVVPTNIAGVTGAEAQAAAFTVDTTAPVVTAEEAVIAFNEGAYTASIDYAFTETNKSTLEVRNASDELLTTIELNGSGSDTIANLAAVWGVNTYKLSCVDEAGNVAEVVVLDQTANTAPEAIAALDAQTFDLSAKTITIAKDAVAALFSDADTAFGDSLRYGLELEAAAGYEGLNYSVSEEGDNYVITLSDIPAAAQTAAEDAVIAQVVAKAVDSYGEEASVIADVTRTDLDLTVNAADSNLNATAIQKQDTDGDVAYTFDASKHFIDPDGNGFEITAVSVKVDGEVNGTASFDGTTVTWIPAEGFTYGAATLEITAADTITGRTTSDSVALTIFWGGVQMTADETSSFAANEGAGAVEALLADSNIGYENTNPSGSVTYTVEVLESEVHGWQIDEDGVRVEQWTSLFAVAPALSADGLTLTYELNPTAYGTASLKLVATSTLDDGSEVVSSQIVPLTIEAMADYPYAADIAGQFQLSKDSVTISMEDSINAGADEDDEDVTIVGYAITSENAYYSEEDDLLFVVKGDYEFALQATYDEASQTYTWAKAAIYDAASHTVIEDAPAELWMELAGEVVTAEYYVQNSVSTLTSSANLTVEFSSYAKNAYGTGERAQDTIEYAWTLEDLCNAGDLEGWTVSAAALRDAAVSGTDAEASVSFGDFGVKIEVPAYGYGELVVDFTVSKEGVGEGAGTITLTLDAVNFEPTWADGVVTNEGGEYLWEEVEDNDGDVEYTLANVSSLFFDYDTPNLTIALASSVVYDGNGQRVGQIALADDTLTFVPDNAEFSTDGVKFQLLVTDTAVDGVPANEDVPFTFLLSIANDDDAPTFKNVPVMRGEVDNEIVIKLSDYLQYVEDSDTPASELSIVMVDQGPLTKVDDDTYTITPTAQGAYTFVIQAFDGEKYSADQEVKIVVGGYESVVIEDASLDVTLSTTYTIALDAGTGLESTSTLAESVLATAGSNLKSGFTLKEGTVLCAGTTIPKGVTFTAAPVGLESDAEVPSWDADSGEYNDGDSFKLTKDWTLNCDMVSKSSSSTARNLTIAGTASLAAGSKLIAGTKFATDTTLHCITEVDPDVAIANVKKIYTDYQTQTVDISDALSGNIATVTMINNTYYDVTDISGSTFTLTLKPDKQFETSEQVAILMENGTEFSFQIDGAGVYDVSALCAGATLAKVTALDSTFATVNVVKNDGTATDQMLVRYAYNPSSSDAESGKVQATLSNGTILTLTVQNAPVYLYQDVVLDLGGSAVASVAFDSLPENSCFKKIEATETGVRVYYEPYFMNQNRGAVTASVELEDGTPISLEIGIDYETPFTFHTTLSTSYDLTKNNVTELPTSVSTISNDGGTYYLEMWIQCDLPSWQSGLITEIAQYGLTPHMTLVANAEAVSTIRALSSPADFSQQWKVSGMTMDAAAMYALLTGITGSAADGTFARLGLYEITTTGDADLTITVTESARNELSLLFNDDYNIGIYRGGTNYIVASQMNYAEEMTFARPSALRGTQAAIETVVEGTGIYMSVSKEASADEFAAALPTSEKYLTEWDSSYVELWLNTQDAGVDITNVSFDLLYDSSLFTATGFEYSSLVDGAEVTFDDAGAIRGIGGNLKNVVTNEDGFVLVGRVKLESAEGDNLASDTVGAVSMGLVLDNIDIQDAVGALIDPNTQVYVNTKVFAMVYDADDNGTVNLNDLLEFSKLFGTSSIDSTDAKVWAMDFDNSGVINLNDLLAFAKNYGVTKETVGETVYPEGFFQQWIGTTLNASGDSNVADTLNTAIRSWEKALGEALNVDVQIIVKDLDNSEYVLGETVLVGLDDSGAPNTAIVYLDSDALGMGWYVGEADAVPTEQYDLYSTLLHELGHALGFNASYTGYTALVSDMYTYTDENGATHLLSQDGHSWEYNDLMFPEISTGVRKEISDLDAEIVSKARANGGEITSQTSYAMTGSVIAAYASGIVPEEAWNSILTAAAEETVAKAAAKAMEAYVAEEDAANVATGAVRANDAAEDFFGEDEFESLLDEIVRDDLDTTL